MITHLHATTWLDNYKQAWETGDPDRIVALFTPQGLYRETPYHAPMQGAEIRRYWEQGPRDGQRDVSFDYRLWTIIDSIALAGWTSRFTRASDGALVELDGVFRLTLVADGDRVLCDLLHEWWHDRQTAAKP